MKVYDHEISESQYAAAVERMQRGSFRASDIEAVLADAGLPQSRYDGKWMTENVAARTADRIIQQKRKLGQIEYSAKRWRWTTPR